MNLLRSPRMRAPLIVLAGAVIAVIAGGTAYGWSSVPYMAPVLAITVLVPYVLGGRDSDVGAAFRGHVDERQHLQRLKIQALVGRILSVAVAAGYAVAVATHTLLWPWAVLLGIFAIAFVGGWFIYGEPGGTGDEE